MKDRAPSLGAFVLRTLLWLPPCLGAWHFGGTFVADAGSALARLMLDALRPGLVETIERDGVDLVFVTTLAAKDASGQTGALLATVDPQLYTFGLALFVALMLAARVRAWMIVAGAALLVPFQAWSITFDFLAQLGIRSGAAVAAQAGLLGWRREAIALGYQVGALILPSLAPVLLWVAFNRGFIDGLLRRPTRDGSATGEA